MNKLVVASLLALSFATGFTCSKNAPEQTSTSVETTTTVAPSADQSQMAAPAEGTATATATAPEASVPASTETK